MVEAVHRGYSPASLRHVVDVVDGDELLKVIPREKADGVPSSPVGVKICP